MLRRLLVVALIPVFFVLGPTQLSAASSDHAAQVNLFLGTSTTPDGSDVIDDFPGADVPFGMIQWSPDTPSQNAGGGYEYNDKAITGFSMTHLSGPGCGVFGDFRMLPTVGAVSNPAKAQQPFSHDNETASPGYYAVTLGNPGVRTEITVTQRTGIAYVTFPAGAAGNLLFNVSSDQAGVRNAGFRVTGPREVEGFADPGGFCGMPNRYSVYFVAQFDTPIASYGTWHAAQTTPGAPRVQGADTGGWVTFDTSKTPRVGVRISVSFIDTNGARNNLLADRRGWNFDAVRNDAYAAWQTVLNRIDVTGGTADEQHEFYSAFYHAMLHPNVFDDADGRYRGYDQRVHRVRRGHHEYANFSDWDIYRTLVPLQALLVPREASDMTQSLVDAAKQGVVLPRWALVNGATSVMGGDSVDPVIAGAYAFGARSFDHRAALAAMVRGASDTHIAPVNGWYVERPELPDYLQRGYIVNTHTTSVSPVPNGASETLEYALDDFSIAEFARAIGNRSVYRTFMQRSANWSNLFDTSAGLIMPRDAQGAFMHPPITDSGQSGFQEGNSAQYTWMVPHDLRDLISGMGGPQATRDKLDTFFTQINAGQDKPYAWLGNEPTLGSPWVYLSAGAPWRAQEIVRKAITTMFANTPHGIPGNDDLGTMSAWYMWCAMGLYPQNPSVRLLDIGSPVFSRIVIKPESGPVIDINAPQAGDDAPYVQQLLVDGRQTQQTWVALPMEGRVSLDFTLAKTANTSWGASGQYAPPSFVQNPVTFPPTTTITLTAPSLDVSVAPDAQATFSVDVDNTASKVPQSITLNASGSSNLQVRPANDSVDIPAGKKVTVKLSVAARDRTGLWNIPVWAQSPNGARTAALRFAVRVENAGQPLQLGYIANRFDNTVTPFDPVTGAIGTPVAAGKEPRDEVFSPDRRYLYVSDRGGKSLAILDTQESRVSYVGVGQSPNGTAITPDGNTVFVANYDDNTIQAIDVRTKKAGKPIAVGTNPRWIAVTPDGRTVLVSNQGGNTVSIISWPAGTRTVDIPVGATPTGIVITPDGKTAYVANSGTNNVTPIDLTTQRALAPIPAGFDASMIALSPDARLAYVSNFSTRTISAIDLATHAARTINVGLSPYGIAFTRDGKTAWVVLRGDSALVPVDVQTEKAGDAVPAGSTSPYSIVIP